MNFILSHMNWVWLTVMVLCIIFEAVTFQLTTVWAAIASLLMIFLCKTGIAVRWQILIFLIITIALIVFTRPFVMKKLKLGKNVTNVNSLIGQEVLVVKAIEQFQKGEGKTKNGVIWTVTSLDGSEIPQGSVCEVKEVDGNTLKIVTK